MVLLSKRDYLDAISSRYNRAAKTLILDEFCATCGFNRKYAIRLLGKPIRRHREKPAAVPVPK